MIFHRRELGKNFVLTALFLPLKSFSKTVTKENKNIELFSKVILFLTDYNIDPNLVKIYYSIFLNSEKNFIEDLNNIHKKRIENNSKAELNALELKIIHTLYTGSINDKMVTYFNALSWSALENFTKPPGVCGGPFGFWHTIPKHL